MNKYRLLLFSFIIISTALFSTSSRTRAGELRGIWISYVDYEDAGLYDKNEEEFTVNANSMFHNLSKYGFNTVYFQVRPYNDAIYPSASFDWCSYLAPHQPDYDPLRILIDAAHKYKLSFHAWINPYRKTSEIIFNPASRSTTDHIVDGVREIIENYDVDGIHFDDYFYPSRHKGNQFYSVSIANRKTNVNNMLRAVYSTVKEYNPDITFGISPAGNIDYAESIGCDLETWCSEDGYTDYIIPQLYWSDYYITDSGRTEYYTDTLDEWTELIDGRKDTYIGLALYKAGLKSDTDKGWRASTHNIADHARLESDYACDGFVLFSYRYIFTQDGQKEFANYIKYISGLKTIKTSVNLKKHKKYKLSNAFKINSKFKKYIYYASGNNSIVSVSDKGVACAHRRGQTWISIKGLAKSKVKLKIKVR